MPISAVNFSRWLERCGFKLQEQPVFHQSVQPVAIVADQSQLVSPSLDPCGVIGGEQAAVIGESSAFLFVSSVPVWVTPVVAANAISDFAISISLGAVGRPVLTAPVQLTPQLFSDGHGAGSKLFCQKGTTAVLPAATVPRWRCASQVSLVVPRFLVPPGGWVLLQTAVANQLLEGAFWFYESPNENAQ